MYVYRTPEFNIQAEKRGILNHVERLCQDLAQMRLDEIEGFNRENPELLRRAQGAYHRSNTITDVHWWGTYDNNDVT
jgi:hypothetical protein